MVDIVNANNLDMSGFEILNAAFQNLSSPPSTGKVGLFCLVTADNTVRYWDGTTWQIFARASDLTEFITASVDNLTNYYLKSETYTRAEVQDLLSTLRSATFQVVDALPQTGEPGIIYLVPKDPSQTSNVKDEYIWVNSAWEKIGDTEIDLSGYLLKNPDIQPGSACKITYDAKGLVTGGQALTAGDIPALDASKISTGIFDVARIPTGNALDKVPLMGAAATQGQVLAYDSASGKFVPVALTQYQPYTDTITGDGTTVDFTRAHGLGRRGIVQVTDAQGNGVNVAYTMDTTNVTLHFGAAPASGVTYNLVVG